MARMRASRPGRPSRIFLTPLAAAALGLFAAPGGGLRADGIGIGRTAEDSAPLLVAYFRRFLDDQDLDAFRDRVDARYSEGALCRLAGDSPVVSNRRAAILALGTLGTFGRSNPVLGRALRDPDPIVRRLAEDSLWSVWFRADTPENNHILRDVIESSHRGETARALAQVTRLIDAAPDFAEAYNQRAIIAFEQGRFDDSARDCRRALELNPYHFGALGGLAQCEIRLDRPAQALETLRRASKLQPYNQGIRQTIRFLAAQIEADAAP